MRAYIQKINSRVLFYKKTFVYKKIQTIKSFKNWNYSPSKFHVPYLLLNQVLRTDQDHKAQTEVCKSKA